MKHPENMTRDELIAYAQNLKGMIRTLQHQLTKALEAVAAEHAEHHTKEGSAHGW